MKKKKTVLDVQFSTDKKARKTARYCTTPVKSRIASFGSYVWLFLLDFGKQRLLAETLYVS